MTSSPPKSLVGRAHAALFQPGVIRKMFTFGAIGVVNFLIDLGVFLLALQYLTGSLIIANVIAWAVAVTFSYVMNSFITFAAESGRQLNWRAYLGFAGSGVLGVVVNTTVLVVAAKFMPLVAAKLLAMGAGFLVNFSMSHFVVFRRRGASGER